MRGKTGVFRRATMILLTFVLVAGYPFTAMADTQEPTTPVVTETTPVTQETPTESVTQTEPQVTYTFNPTTNTWESEEWQFDATTNTYERPPAPIIVEPEITDESTTDVDKDIKSDVTLNTNLNSDATSGDAFVFENTLGGDATSGDAAAMANVLNVVNSTIGATENQQIAQFTQDVLGDVKGDIILSPLLLKAFLEAQAPEGYSSSIDVNNNFAINNDLTLNATSGDATVSGNTTAGDATTGSATAVANVVNVLNSMIAAQQSFIGTINIYGNLEGDILIAPDFIPQLIASNGGTEADLKVSTQDTQNIVNNISAVAESGAASVFGNTTGGDATTGSADTNVVIFNLSGHEIVAENSLLVFVNVLGKWVGVIVDAPEGATSAMIGNGVTQNNYAPDLTVNSESSYGITNTIALNAKTGDALVSNNTTAGNAVSGSAQAMANIANVTGSQISTRGWFGVLFINVFQNWYGSFGVDTPYGNASAENQAPQAPVEFRPTTTNSVQTTRAMRVIDSRSFAEVEPVVAAAAVISSDDEAENLAEFAAQSLGSVNNTGKVSQDDYRLLIIAGSILVIGLSVIGLKRLFS